MPSHVTKTFADTVELDKAPAVTSLLPNGSVFIIVTMKISRARVRQERKNIANGAPGIPGILTQYFSSARARTMGVQALWARGISTRRDNGCTCHAIVVLPLNKVSLFRKRAPKIWAELAISHRIALDDLRNADLNTTVDRHWKWQKSIAFAKRHLIFDK